MTDAGVDVDQVTAFRLCAHHLDRRLGSGNVLRAAGACALQDSPPGSAVLALHARVDGVGPDTITGAVENRSLLHTWCMRGSPYYFPTTDLPVFTTGVLPTDEAARRRFVLGVEHAVDRLGMGLDEATDHVRSAIGGVLGGRRLAINELGAQLAKVIAADLPVAVRRIWQEEGPYAAGQPLGEAVIHFCLRLLTLEQVVCFAHRESNKLPFTLVEEWLGTKPPAADGEAARAEIARRYLRCYGPSTRAELAAWLGIAAQDAGPWWSVIEGELCEVRVDGNVRWLLAADLDALSSPPQARGVRVLSPRDPVLQLRDRASLVPDTTLHSRVWQTVGGPGAILVDGRLVATWRPRKKGKKLTVSVEPFTSLTKATRVDVAAEVASIAPLRGCSSSEVSFSS